MCFDGRPELDQMKPTAIAAEVSRRQTITIYIKTYTRLGDGDIDGEEVIRFGDLSALARGETRQMGGEAEAKCTQTWFGPKNTRGAISVHYEFGIGQGRMSRKLCIVNV